MCKTKTETGEFNPGGIDSFTLLSSCCDIEKEGLNVHTEKIVLSICALRLLSEQSEELDLKMELVAILYEIKLEGNPNLPTIFRGIGRALGKYLSVESEMFVDITDERHTHETIVAEILAEGYAAYKNGRLSEMRLVNLLDMVRDMDYQDVLATAQEEGKAVYVPKIMDKGTYLSALDKILHL